MPIASVATVRISKAGFARAAIAKVGVVVIAGLAAAPAAAGTIIAKATITYCAVQAVNCGNEDPSSCQLIFNSALAAGEAIVSDTGSLCYRRNLTPDDCRTALQPDWRCITNYAEAPKRDAIR